MVAADGFTPHLSSLRQHDENSNLAETVANPADRFHAAPADGFHAASADGFHTD